MKEYLKKDKTTNAVKIANFHEHLSAYKDLKSLQEKLALAMEEFKTKVNDDLSANFSDDDGCVQIDMLREVVSNTLAVKRANEMGD